MTGEQMDGLGGVMEAQAQVEQAQMRLEFAIAARDREIRAAHAAGMSCRRIAAVIDLSYQRVGQVVRMP